MYVQINDNQLIAWSSEAFVDAVEIDLDYDTFITNKDKYAVIEGVLTDISNTDEYKSQQLQGLKAQKLAENQKALDTKETLTTSFGVVKVNTPIGRVDVMATGFLNLVSITETNLPEGTFRTYSNGEEMASPELTPEQVGAFYLEIFNGLNNCDKRYKQIETSINNAQSLDELEAIDIDYTDI